MHSCTRHAVCSNITRSYSPHKSLSRWVDVGAVYIVAASVSVVLDDVDNVVCVVATVSVVLVTVPVVVV